MTDRQKKDIEEWLTGEMNREKGLSLFQQTCPNRILARSAYRFSAEKLEYEMKKLLGINPMSIFGQKCSNKQLINEHNQTDKKAHTAQRQMGEPETRPAQRRPQASEKTESGQSVADNKHIILQAKTAIADLTVEIAKLHNDLYETGTENTAKNTAKRRRILEKRLELIHKKDEIYKLKESYFKTGVISPELTRLVNEDTGKKDDKTKPEDMTDIQLVKELKNAKTNWRKNLNMLEYQTPAKQDKPNPMPAGMKRKEVEKRVRHYKNMAEAIEKELTKRNNKDK